MWPHRGNLHTCKTYKRLQMQEGAGPMKREIREVVQGGSARSLLHLICNLACILRISIHGRPDLLSPLYAASRAQVTFGPTDPLVFKVS